MKFETAFPDHPIAYHERLTLENFTMFSRETFEFVPGINVLIGENGTGKTHVLKALYAWQIARHLIRPTDGAQYNSYFATTYGADSASQLQRRPGRPARASGRFHGEEWSVALSGGDAVVTGSFPIASRPVFIPATEIMAHARNMNGVLREYADFDRTYHDFISLVTLKVKSNAVDPGADKVAGLSELVPGSVEWDEQQERFYLNETGRRIPFALVAEGVRKISALERLVQLGWIAPGTVLLWDEPEVSINPRWMDRVIGALVTMAQNGVQIFLATHSYVALKQIDLIRRWRQHNGSGAEVPVRFFSLSKSRGAGKVTWADGFAALEPNPIIDAYHQMLASDWQLSDAESDR